MLKGVYCAVGISFAGGRKALHRGQRVGLSAVVERHLERTAAGYEDLAASGTLFRYPKFNYDAVSGQ